MVCEPDSDARAMAWLKVLGCGFAEGGAVMAAWASDALLALERRLTCVYRQPGLPHVAYIILYLVANALSKVAEAFAHIGRIVVGLVGILARRGQEFLVRRLERLDAGFKLDVVMRQLRLLRDATRLFSEPLRVARGKRRYGGRHLVGECTEFIHGLCQRVKCGRDSDSTCTLVVKIG